MAGLGFCSVSGFLPELLTYFLFLGSVIALLVVRLIKVCFYR